MIWLTQWWWVALIAVVGVRLIGFVLRVEREQRETPVNEDPDAFSPVFVMTQSPENYVFIEEDGTSRELTAEETTYLTNPFAEDDEEAPYVKWSYEERTPDGKLGGFLERRLLPSEIAKAERFARTLRSD